MQGQSGSSSVGIDPQPGSDRVAGSADSDELLSALLAASRVLVGISARSLAGVEETVTLTQFRTMVVICGHGPTTLVRLASRLGVNASTAQRSVDRLVAAGLVDRRENPQDRRELVIDLTQDGARLVAEVSERRRSAIREIVASMPADQHRRLVEALEAFARAADEPLGDLDASSRLGW